MDKISFSKAHYITLGKKFHYAGQCIQEGTMRFDWKEQPIEYIHDKKWDLLKQRIAKEMNFSKAATHDFNSLKAIAEAKTDEIWITRYKECLWWGKLNGTPMKEDNPSKSKYRVIQGGWSNKDINGTKLKITKSGRKWFINNNYPTIARTLKYSATECSVNDHYALEMLLNGHQ